MRGRGMLVASQEEDRFWGWGRAAPRFLDEPTSSTPILVNLFSFYYKVIRSGRTTPILVDLPPVSFLLWGSLDLQEAVFLLTPDGKSTAELPAELVEQDGLPQGTN